MILEQNSLWIQFWQLKYYICAVWNESFQVLVALGIVYSMVISLFTQTFSGYRIQAEVNCTITRKSFVRSLQDHRATTGERAHLKEVVMLPIHMYD